MRKRPRLPPGRLAAALLALCVVSVAGCAGSGESSTREGGGGTDAEAPFSTAEWKTDFSRASVPLDDFQSGGPPKDGIPAIDDPRFVSVRQADGFLSPREPVAVLELGGEARAYPLQILIWHEIVNDEIGGRPVAVTFCPLCNSTVAFSRELDGRVLDFGTTGKLRNSDLVMYDRQTESWWQQLTAEAIVGELAGARLEVLPSQILSWEQFKRQAPDGSVLSRDTGIDRDYGANPYVGYDRADSSPFLYEGELDDRLPPKERVTAIRTGDDSAVVYPFSRLAEERVVEDDLDGTPIVVLYDPAVRSALDASQIAAGDEVGAAAVFDRRLDGRTLSFQPGAEDGSFTDRQTGSTWDVGGEATDGELAGSRLERVPFDDQFWFALAAFFPQAEIRG